VIVREVIIPGALFNM